MHNARSPIVLVVVLMSLIAVTPVWGAPLTEDAQSATQALPPIPEWPIIGPILKMLGIVPEQPPAEVLPTPDPALPEYRITTPEDLNQLQDIEPGTRVRVVASDTDLNQIIQQALDEKVGNGATAHVTFGTNLVTFSAAGSADLVKQLGFDLPPMIRGTLNVSTTLTLSAANCRAVVQIKTLSVNGWSAGLKGIAQRAINGQLPSMWPADACVEQIIVTPGEIAVEGYRVPQ